MRTFIPRFLSSKQIENLQSFFLNSEIKFDDEFTQKQFYDLLEQYIFCRGAIAVDHRNRLKNLINQLSEKNFSKINNILGPEKAPEPILMPLQSKPILKPAPLKSKPEPSAILQPHTTFFAPAPLMAPTPVKTSGRTSLISLVRQKMKSFF
jgi:hypothetical protein